jgi:hypothetical protein
MREPRSAPSFDRIWRLVALFALCGLIYYFSFQNGLQTSKAQNANLRREVVELQAQNERLRAMLRDQAREYAALLNGRGPGVDVPAEGVPEAGGGEGEGARIGAAGAAAASAGEGGPAVQPSAAQDGPSVARLILRNEENRLILDSKVLISVGDIDSLDRTAVVRVHDLDTERREARTMQTGDSMVIERGGAGHRLLLDQLKGSQAVFVLISP